MNRNKEQKLLRHCRRFLLLSPLSPIGAPTAAADTYPRSTTVDAIHYRLTLALTANSNELRAETEILFEFRADGVREVALDFAGLTIDQVTEENKPARFTRTGDKLKIALGGNYRRGDRCHVAVKYHGRPSDGRSEEHTA